MVRRFGFAHNDDPVYSLFCSHDDDGMVDGSWYELSIADSACDDSNSTAFPKTSDGTDETF